MSMPGSLDTLVLLKYSEKCFLEALSGKSFASYYLLVKSY